MNDGEWEVAVDDLNESTWVKRDCEIKRTRQQIAASFLITIHDFLIYLIIIDSTIANQIEANLVAAETKHRTLSLCWSSNFSSSIKPSISIKKREVKVTTASRLTTMSTSC